jgi:hypothetical protein
MQRDKERLIGFLEAVSLAGVAKRTIDNWVRHGWLTPAAEGVPNGRGRPGRRFRASDVLQVAEKRGTLVRDESGNLVSPKREAAMRIEQSPSRLGDQLAGKVGSRR